MAALDMGPMWLLAQRDRLESSASSPEAIVYQQAAHRRQRSRDFIPKHKKTTSSPSASSMLSAGSPAIPIQPVTSSPASRSTSVLSTSAPSFFDLPTAPKRRRQRQRDIQVAAIAAAEENEEELRQRQQRREETNQRNEDASRVRARAYLDDFVQRDPQWSDIRHHITVVYDAVPTMAEMESWGELNEADGTLACRKMFRAPVVWDELGRSLWGKLQTIAEQKRDALAGLSPLLEVGGVEEEGALSGPSAFFDSPSMYNAIKLTSSRGPDSSPSFSLTSSNASSPSMVGGTSRRFRSGSFTSVSEASTPASTFRMPIEGKRTVGPSSVRWGSPSASRTKPEEPVRPSTASGYSGAGIGIVHRGVSPAPSQSHQRTASGLDGHCSCCGCGANPELSRRGTGSTVGSSQVRSASASRARPGAMAMVMGLASGAPQAVSAFDYDYTDSEDGAMSDAESHRRDSDAKPSALRGAMRKVFRASGSRSSSPTPRWSRWNDS